MHNVDDKAIITAWLFRRPRIIWKIQEDNKLTGSLSLHEDGNGDIAGIYVIKYSAKGAVKRLSDGDTLPLASENLHPENRVTNDTFTRMYNQTCQSGPQPIFQAVHNNLSLPLFDMNFQSHSFSTMNVSLIRKRKTTEANENNEMDGVEYALPTVLERFNRRFDDTVLHQGIKATEFRNKCLYMTFVPNSNLSSRHPKEKKGAFFD